jgi:tetratricopeptide (TPR) repeat protein
MITLLRVAQTINAGKIEDDLPPLQGGSREVHHVYNAFAKLIKVVRMSNISFFSGNLHLANDFISDALKLFRKVNDQKAIGIASNNLGNTLYAIAHEAGNASEFGSDSHPFTQYDTAMAHFNEAIEIGQRGCDEAIDENDKADFAQQLADRLFNRAAFGLLGYFLGTAPDDGKAMALQDLKRVREIDCDVRDYLLERKLLLKNADSYFSRLIRRIHGLLEFYHDDDVRELWNPKELIEEADHFLFAAWNEPNAAFFEEVTPVGRLQQLESAAMRLDLILGKKMDAARLAMRMFVEDEYLLESAFASATRALLELIRDDASDSWTIKTKTSCRQDLRMILRSCKNKSVDLGKSVVIGLEINEQFEGDPILEKIHSNCLRLYDAYCTSDDHVGVVAYTVNGDLNVELGLKADNEGRQRAGLDLATSSTNDNVCPALPYATQMLVDSAVSENDSYIILVADGYSWDPATFSSVRLQIDRLNRERNATVHLFILGLDVEETEVIDSYKSMCTVSRLSHYSDISMANIDSTFRMIGDIMCGHAMDGSRFQGLTMEKF